MEILVIILTSGVVSTIVSFMLKVLFEQKSQHKLNQELHDFKHQKEKSLEEFKVYLAEEKAERKEIKETLNMVSTQVSNARRAAKDSLENIFNVASYYKELNQIVKDVENQLDASARILRKVDIYNKIHDYKNTIVTYNAQLMNFGTSKDKNMCLNILREIYTNINREYEEITKKIYKIIDEVYLK